MNKKLFFQLGLFFSFLMIPAFSWSQTIIQVAYDTGSGTPFQQVEAVFRAPQGRANGQALLILHHGGGYSYNTTQQYAELFSNNGFATLELIMFHDTRSRNRPDPMTRHAQVMGGLRYLAQVPGVDRTKVSALGMSMGAFLTIGATSSWFYQHHQAGDLRFHKLVAMYPVCWIMNEALNGQTQDISSFKGLPNTFLQQFAEIPLLILAAGKDSYDGLDAGVCSSFAKNIPNPVQAGMTKVEVFTNATHGWDHGKDYSVPVQGGCLGRTNCTNRIVSSPVTVEQGKKAVMNFLISR